MTLLVTGATGHVGSAIVALAAQRGMEVLALSRAGQPAAEARTSARVHWARCNLADAAAVLPLAAERRIDACIHAAAVSNEAYARPDPLAAVAANLGATANLLEAARTHGWRRFIFVSTGSVFQKRADILSPIHEDEPPAPGNIYSTTKAAAEMLVRMYRTEFGLSAASVRLSWIYGPPVVTDSPTRGPIPSYALRALRGEAIREGGGDFAASFTHVADAAAGLIAAAGAERLRADVYHVGPGVNFSARQVAEVLRAVCPGAAIEIGGGTDPWTTYTAMRGPLAGTRLHDDTGFTPAYSLEAGIAAYLEWMRANPQAWRR